MSSAAKRAAEPHQRAMQSDELLEATEKCNDALVNVLKQACSRNRAMERKAMWNQRTVEDQGSRSSLTLKSNSGVAKTVHLVPKGAEVTKNYVNKFEEERQRMAEAKEDVLLTRFCDGKDNAWRPDSFFAEACGDGDGEVPPWPIRPTELFTNPHICMRIMAKTMEEKKKRKAEKKSKKEQGKRAKKAKKTKKDKKDKKGKKEKAKKKKKKKERKSKKEDRKVGGKRARASSNDSASDGSVAVQEIGSDSEQQQTHPQQPLEAPASSPPPAASRSHSGSAESSSSNSEAAGGSVDFGDVSPT